MSRIDFSIIVPFYNKERTIESCIQGLLAQEYPKDQYEVIFVNNNSSDSSCQIIAKYPSLKLIQEKRQGAYIARNAGILSSSGSYLIFSDADALAPKDWLSNIHSAIRQGNFDIVIGWYQPASNSRLLAIHSLLICERIRIALSKKQVSMLTASASNLVIKRAVFEKEGFFMDLPRSEDKYFIIRCFEKGYNIGFSDKIGVTRNDIDSLGVALQKNFTYGYANAMYIDRRLSPLRWIMWEFLFKWFPQGAGLLLFSFFYYTGYCLGRIRCRIAAL
jgi:glycosyltransferase involved in cell wall biosynthesis